MVPVLPDRTVDGLPFRKRVVLRVLFFFVLCGAHAYSVWRAEHGPYRRVARGAAGAFSAAARAGCLTSHKGFGIPLAASRREQQRRNVRRLRMADVNDQGLVSLEDGGWQVADGEP